MKKWYAFLFALAWIVSLCLSGCKKSEPLTVVPYDQLNRDEWKEMTLEYWCAGDTQQLDAEVETAANEILQQDLPNTSVHFTWIPSNQIADLSKRALAAEENIDMLYVYTEYGQKETTKEWVRSGVFVDLSPYYDTYLTDYAATVGDVQRKIYQVDGKDYFFSTSYSNTTGYRGLGASTQLLKDIGYDPKEWSDTLTALAASSYKNRTPESDGKLMEFFEIYGAKLNASGIYANDPFGSIHMNAPQTVLSGGLGDSGYIAMGWIGNPIEYSLFRFPVGTDVNAADFKLETVITSDLQKYQWLKSAEWYDKGWIRTDVEGYTLAVFGIGNPKNFPQSIYETGDLASRYPSCKLQTVELIGSHGEYQIISDDIAHDLTIAGLVPVTELYTQWSGVTAIPTTVKRDGLERAMVFQNYLYSDAGKNYYRTVIYGREGFEWDWEKNPDQTGMDIQWYSNPSITSIAYGKQTNSFGTVLHQLSTNPVEKIISVQEYALLREMAETAWINPYEEFIFNVYDEAIVDRYTEINTVFNEYSVLFTTGALGVEGFEKAYAEMVQRLQDAGIDELKAEATRQVQAYAKEHSITTGWDAGY